MQKKFSVGIFIFNLRGEGVMQYHVWKMYIVKRWVDLKKGGSIWKSYF